MKKIEYKHVRHMWKPDHNLTKKEFHQGLMEVLSKHGDEGWELKGVIHEGGLHAHLIFAREATV